MENSYDWIVCKTSIILNIYLFLSPFLREDNPKLIYKNLNIIYQILNAKQVIYIISYVYTHNRFYIYIHNIYIFTHANHAMGLKFSFPPSFTFPQTSVIIKLHFKQSNENVGITWYTFTVSIGVKGNYHLWMVLFDYRDEFHMRMIEPF